MTRNLPVAAMAGALTFILAMFVSGCLIYSNTDQKRTGNYVPSEAFDQIKPGSTTNWVKATLGEPTTRTTDRDDEVWKYIYTERTDSSGAVFLVFGGHDSKETPGSAVVEFKNGLVVNKWRAPQHN